MATGDPLRQDFQVAGEAEISLFVREVCVEEVAVRQPSILLLHGARVPGLASFDLPVLGGSLAADLAAAGHTTYIMDARGYGGSTRPAAMEKPPDRHQPVVRTGEVARDIAAVVAWITARERGRPPAALGWATGGQWLGCFATLHPDALCGLILLNALYGSIAEHPSIGRGSDLEDPDHPSRFHATSIGAYRYNSAAGLLPGWDSSIPIDDHAAWRDPAIAAAYQKAALASDPTSETRSPPSFRAPSGALEDSFYLASGRQLWDASLLRVPTLCIRAERDFWSRPGDPDLLAAHAAYAPVRVVTIANATHFVHLDRPERGRTRLLTELLDFLVTTTGEADDN